MHDTHMHTVTFLSCDFQIILENGNIDGGGGGRILKKICYFSNPSTPPTLFYARITKLICMIPLWIQMVATFLKYFYVFQFWNNSDFSDFIQKCNFSVNFSRNWLNFLSVWGGGWVIYNIYQTGFIMWLSDHPRKWKYRWRGRILKKNVTSVTYQLPRHCFMLESPNIYAWYPYEYRLWQRIWNFSTSSMQFWNNSDFRYFTPKCHFSVNYSWNCLKICKCMGGGGSYTSYIKRVLSCDLRSPSKIEILMEGA